MEHGDLFGEWRTQPLSAALINAPLVSWTTVRTCCHAESHSQPKSA